MKEIIKCPTCGATIKCPSWINADNYDGILGCQECEALCDARLLKGQVKRLVKYELPEPEKSREIGVTPIYRKNRDAEKKTVVNVGGSGSSKSYSVGQLLVYKLVTEDNKRFVIARKTMPACKRSNYDLIISFLKDYGIYREDHHNKTDHIYRHKNNEMLFMGLDEPTKIKSVSTGVNYVWLEEANEFTYEDYLMFLLQVRRATPESEKNHIYLTLNPIDSSNWIAQKLCKNIMKVE